MIWWLCSECSYILKADQPPSICPQCRKACQFSDVSCFIPECGGPGNLDARLVAFKAAEAKKTNS